MLLRQFFENLTQNHIPLIIEKASSQPYATQQQKFN